MIYLEVQRRARFFLHGACKPMVGESDDAGSGAREPEVAELGTLTDTVDCANRRAIRTADRGRRIKANDLCQ